MKQSMSNQWAINEQSNYPQKNSKIWIKSDTLTEIAHQAEVEQVVDIGQIDEPVENWKEVEKVAVRIRSDTLQMVKVAQKQTERSGKGDQQSVANDREIQNPRLDPILDHERANDAQ